MRKRNSAAKAAKAFLSSKEVEHLRNLHLAKVISILVSVLGLLVMGPLSLAQNNISTAIGSFAYGTLAVFAAIYTFIKKDLLGFNTVTIFVTYFLIIQYMITGGNEGFGLTWVLIFSLLYLYMLNTKFFVCLVIANLLVIAIVFFSPLNKYIYDGWNFSYKIRFTLVLLVESVLAISFKLATNHTDRNRDEIFMDLMDLQKTLQDKVKTRTEQLLYEKRHSEKFMIELSMSLAATIDAKDKYTSGHSKRVAEYSKEIAKRLGKSETEQEHIYLIALLHDIGKIGIPDEIINKKTKLTAEEYDIIKQHPSIGSDILKNIESVPEIRTGVRWHHERFDGNGYPDRLKENEIPEYAQIVAVADAYDAMTSNRGYRSLLPQAAVRNEIEKGIGTQFSPKMANIMLTIIDDDKNYTHHE